MNSKTNEIVGLSIIVVVFIGVMWVLGTNNIAFQSVFAPKYEQIRRDTFKESEAYNDGMKQELYSMMREYLKADDEHRAGLKSIIIHRTDEYDIDRLPEDLREFIKNLRSE